jgi:protein TonB
LCLWASILLGFALLLRNHPAPPAFTPLEVSLADFSRGLPGGSAGGGPGAPPGGSEARLKTLAASPPSAHTAAPKRTDSAAPRLAPKPEQAVSIAHKSHHRRVQKMPRPVDIGAAAGRALARPEHASGVEEAVLRRHSWEDESAPPPSSSKLPAPESKPAPSAGSAVASLGGPGPISASGGGGMGGGIGGSTGIGNGGQGTGVGGGIGEDSQVYATVAHPPVPMSTVLPQYPGEARSEGVEGEVVLRAIVDKGGAVEPRIVVVESVPMLDRAAVEALRQWHFSPGRDAGNHPVRVVIEVPLRFRLR